MLLEILNSSLGLFLTVAAAGGVLAAWVKHWRPRLETRRRREIAKNDAILGREAKYDSITGELVQPPLPGIGVRMANTEGRLDVIGAAVEKIAETLTLVNNHETRITALEEARVEHVVSRVESAQAYRTIEAAISAEPPQLD